MKTFTNPDARPVKTDDTFNVTGADGSKHKYKYDDLNTFIDSTTGAITATTLTATGAVDLQSTATVADVAKFEVGVTLKEITTPAALADYGKIYTKSDNNLYFQDGAGTEKTLQTGSIDYGEMGNTASATEVLAEADEWYAMHNANINTGLVSGFTYTDGQSGVIASIGEGVTGDVVITDEGHNLEVGDYITVNGCTDSNYNGVFEVNLVPTANTFTITATWGATDTGFWQEGSYLECNTAGIYRGVWNAVVTQTGTNKIVYTSPFVNTAESTKAYNERTFSGASDVGSVGGNGLMSFAVGDRIWFAVKSDLAQTVTYVKRNVTVR